MVSLQRAYSLHLMYPGCMHRLVIVTFSIKSRGSALDVATIREPIRLYLLLLVGIEVFVRLLPTSPSWTSLQFHVSVQSQINRHYHQNGPGSLQAHIDHITSLPLLEAIPALLDLTASPTTSLSPEG